MAAKEETRTDTTPKRLGRYRLLRKIARGGMAEVFVGRSYGAHGFEKTVAVKRILSSFSEDPQFVRMMVDEAKISVLLTHPNIAQVLEFGEEDGRYFLVMEYVPGQSLSVLVKRLRAADERLGVLESCFVVVEALQGLHAAHIQTDPWGKPAGIIHRDVSPQNLLLSYDGHVKVIDFGIARARDRLEKTQVGTIKGKLRYLSPEMIDPQRFSKRGDFDHRVDVFAAGIILFELVAGRTLFTGADEIQVYDHITRGDIPDLEAEGLCDAPLMRIIQRALERDPDQRFPSAEAFADELRAYLYRRDPAFTNKRLAAVLDRHFAEEKEQRQQLEEPDPALEGENLDLNLTRTSHTPSQQSLVPKGAAKDSGVWAASAPSLVSSPSSSQQTGTSVSRRAPRNRRASEPGAALGSGKRSGIEQALGGHLAAPHDAETRVGDIADLVDDVISQTEADTSHVALADDDDEIETSTSAVPARVLGGMDPGRASAVVRRDGASRPEPHEDTPATRNRLEPRAARGRGPLIAVALAALVGLLLAVAVVVGLESSSDDIELVSLTPDPATVSADDTVPLIVAASPESARIELVGREGTSKPPAVFMVLPGETVEVRVSAPGYEARRETVPIPEGEDQVRRSIDLVALPVRLVLDVTPANAQVSVDGSPYEAGMDVKPGAPLVVTARADGFEPLEQPLEPVAGEPLKVTLNLTPEPVKDTPRRQQVTQRPRPKPKATAKGTLTITSTPYWGRVTIDGKTLEETTPLTVRLKAGSYSVEVSHPPKGMVERFTVKLDAGQKLRRTVKFR